MPLTIYHNFSLSVYCFCFTLHNFFSLKKKCNFYNTVIVYKEYSMLCTLDKAFLTLYFYLLVGLVANSSFQKASSLYRFDVPHCLMKKTYTTILIFLCQPFYKKTHLLFCFLHAIYMRRYPGICRKYNLVFALYTRKYHLCLGASARKWRERTARNHYGKGILWM